MADVLCTVVMARTGRSLGSDAARAPYPGMGARGPRCDVVPANYPPRNRLHSRVGHRHPLGMSRTRSGLVSRASGGDGETVESGIGYNSAHLTWSISLVSQSRTCRIPVVV
jgi:hypothetical protein